MNGPEPGLEILPGLTLLRRLGRGGMGEAWLARDAERGCDVVAKLLAADADPGKVALLRREARLVRKLLHPRIVPVYAFHAGARANVVTLRYMPGGDAGRLRGAPVAEIVSLGCDVADALAYLHDKGVVHRDVKLSNVLLDAEGRAHLADFGIASLARGEEDGLVLKGGGSRASMSPEQRAGGLPQPADDLYALGVLLHELLAGEPPVDGTSAAAPRVRLPVAVPARLRGLVSSLLAATAAERPRSAIAVRDELEAIAGELTRPSKLEPQAVRLQPPPRIADRVVRPSSDSDAPPRAISNERRLVSAPLALVVGLSLLAVASVLWLPRWATAPAPVVAAPSSPAPSAVTTPPAEAGGRTTPEALPPRVETRVARPTAEPVRKAAAYAHPTDPTPTPPAVPEPAPTADRQAEAAELARHRDAGQAKESREDWRGALAEYEAALAIDGHVTFALEGRERARRRAELDEALAFHSQRPERLSAPAVGREAEQLLERARGVQPAGPALEARIAALEQALSRARTPVAVVIESDGLTELTLSRVGRLGTLTRRSLELLPGSYTLTGSRRGFRDVRRQFSVAPGTPVPAVALRCEEAI